MPDEKKPEDVINDLDQNAKDQREFEEVFDEIFDEDMEEREPAAAPKPDGENEDEAHGEGTKDPDPTNDPDAVEGKPSDASKDDPNEDTTDADSDVSFWMSRARQLEQDLSKEQQKTKSWNGRIEAANKRAKEAEERVKELEAKIQNGETPDGPTPDSDSSVAKVLEDFPEIKPLVDSLQKQIASQQVVIDSLKQPRTDGPNPDDGAAENTPDTSTGQDTPQADESAQTSARATILSAHPDMDRVLASGKLEPWIAKQPAYLRSSLQRIYDRGTPDEVVSMVTTFKKESGWKQPGTSDTDTKKKKLDSMKQVNSEGSGPPSPGPNKDDFDGTAKEIGL